MRPEISEFSYGFALTSELVDRIGHNLRAAPVFPSLRQEGQERGGWDVRLDLPGLPLFVQFKLSECMKRRNAKEAKMGLLDVPYYRMGITSRSRSKQHEMLVDLDRSGEAVYYAAPAFHSDVEFDTAYMTRRVTDRSVWIRPSDIGYLSDDGQHHVSFLPSGLAYFCSEPKRLDSAPTLESFAQRLQSSLSEWGETPFEQTLGGLSERIEAIVERDDRVPSDRRVPIVRELFNIRPLERISFYAQVFLNCQLFVVQWT